MSTQRSGVWGPILVLAGLGLAALSVVTWLDVLVTGRLPEAPNDESNVAGVMCAPPVAAICLIVFGAGLTAQAWRATRTSRYGASTWGVVTSIDETGVRIDDVPQVRVRVQVDEGDAAPLAAGGVVMSTPQFRARVSVGSRVALIVDPADAENAVIDWSEA